MLCLGIGLMALIGYVIFDQKYPKRKLSPAETFEMIPIVFGDNFIQCPEKGLEYNGITEYNVICKIKPCKAKLIDELYYDMIVPEEYIISSFVIGVDSTDCTVIRVELNRSEYHVDKCPKTHCFFLGDLQDAEFTRDFMISLMARLMVYELEHSMAFDHWSNNNFLKLNNDLICHMKKTA